MQTTIPRNGLVAAATLLGLCSALLAYQYVHGRQEPGREIVRARKGELTRQVSATGTVRSTVTVEIRSEVSGIVREVFAAHNHEVSRGQVLAEIDPAVYQLALDRAQARLLEARALAEKGEVQWREAQRRLDRTRSLFDAGTVSQTDLEAAQSSHRSAAMEREAQHAQVAQRETDVRAAEIDLAHTRIAAPLDGIVLARAIEVGEMVEPAARASVLFVIGTDPAHLQLEADVAEADIGAVRVGQQLVFTVDAFPGITFAGDVTEVRMGPTVKQQAVYYRVEAAVANSELLLRPGMTADVRITTAVENPAILVPAAALRSDGGESYVELFEGGTIERRPVTTGIKNTAGFVAVVSGLSEGDRIVVSGQPE